MTDLGLTALPPKKVTPLTINKITLKDKLDYR